MQEAIGGTSALLASVMFVPDLHKRDVDFTSIKGFIGAVEQVQKDIIEALGKLEKPVFVSLGDWYDKGYRSTARTLADIYYDRKIAEKVGGDAYICLGNHFFLERDANPEMYIIQPSYLYKPRKDFPNQEAIFKTVPYLVIGDVQISFFHFNKEDKNYIQPVQPGVRHHIGIYHDDCVLPSNVRQQAGGYGTTSNDYLNSIYSNVDLAIHGHIHISVGTNVYSMNSGKSVPMLIPGSLGITQNKEEMKHKSVQCPVVKIYEGGGFDVDFVEVSTHLDMLSFYKVQEKTLAMDSMEIMGSGDGSKLSIPKARTLIDFLRNEGYSQNDVEHIMQIRPGMTDVYTIMGFIKEDLENAESGSYAGGIDA